MTWQTLSTGSAETEALGVRLGRLLKPPAVLELRSDLGGGKTTFARGLARGLGSKDAVTSPTFTLNQIYTAKDGVKISHHDFYRLNETGIMSGELAESLDDDKTITVVEWANIAQGILPDDRLTVELNPVADNTNERTIKISYPPKFKRAIKGLETDSTIIKP
jgi:tRNA threonylcarbamoyladenosine biosynthesis protein TsaE